jgi:hypothetical protein
MLKWIDKGTIDLNRLRTVSLNVRSLETREYDKGITNLTIRQVRYKLLQFLAESTLPKVGSSNGWLVTTNNTVAEVEVQMEKSGRSKLQMDTNFLKNFSSWLPLDLDDDEGFIKGAI